MSPAAVKDFPQEEAEETTLLFHDGQFYDDQDIKLALIIQWCR